MITKEQVTEWFCETNKIKKENLDKYHRYAITTAFKYIYDAVKNNGAPSIVNANLHDLDIDKAEELAMKTDYACFAVEENGNDINTSDAGAFFLEGYKYAKRIIENEAKKLNNQQGNGVLPCVSCSCYGVLDDDRQAIIKLFSTKDKAECFKMELMKEYGDIFYIEVITIY